jgi:hypothetical protein
VTAIEQEVGVLFVRRGLIAPGSDSAVLLEAAEAALPPEQLAIYKGPDKEAKLALDSKLFDSGAIPDGILHRYELFATPLRDLGWMLLKALAILLLIAIGVVCVIL